MTKNIYLSCEVITYLRQKYIVDQGSLFVRHAPLLSTGNELMDILNRKL